MAYSDPISSSVPWGLPPVRQDDIYISAERYSSKPDGSTLDRRSRRCRRHSGTISYCVDVSITDSSRAYPARIAAESMFSEMQTGTADNIINLLVGAGAGF